MWNIITHTCIQHSPKCACIHSSCSPLPPSASPSIHHVPLQAEAHTCLYRRCWLLGNGPTQGTYNVVAGFSTTGSYLLVSSLLTSPQWTGCLDHTLRRIEDRTTTLVKETSDSYSKP